MEPSTLEGPAGMTRAAPAPVSTSRRLLAIDAARGFALLGIYLVNVQSFGEAFGRFTLPVPPPDEGPLGLALFYLAKVFAEGKFYPLFSMLFGIGLVLQMRSVESRGGSFFGVYGRRLAVLMLFGLVHALLMWYGDILFIYAFAGLLLMVCARARGKVLLWVGVGLVALVSIFGGALAGLGMLGSQAQSAAAASSAVEPVPALAMEPGPLQSEEHFFESPEGDSRVADDAAPPAAEGVAIIPVEQQDWLDRAAAESSFWSLIRSYRDGKITGGPEQPLWIELETQAYRDGPFLDAFLFRSTTWLFFIFFCFFGFGWHIAAVFFIGAGLMKLGLLEPEKRAWRRRLILLGLFVGLPGAIAAAALPSVLGLTPVPVMLSAMLLFACGPMMSVMYLCAVVELVGAAGRWTARIAGVLASVGRMALTNYIMHTLVFTFVFYWWGLGLFGQLTRPERIALVPMLFLAQCVISPLWLRVFRFGPMEWVWRTLTYWKRQPVFARAGRDADGRGEAAA